MSQLGRTCLGGGKCVEHEEDYPYTMEASSQTNQYLVSQHVSPETAGQYVGTHYSQSRVSYDDTAAVPNTAEYYHDVREQLRRASHHQSQNDLYRDVDLGSSPALLTKTNNGALASTTDGENTCSCELLMLGNFKWVLQKHYAVVKNGREYYDRYVVMYRLPNSNVQYDMFTHTEGLVRAGPVETKFPELCGEVLASHKLAPINSLTNACYYTPPRVDPNAPFHVQEEVCKTNNLTAVPLKINTAHQVLVFRTYNGMLALQLMPTAFSEQNLVPGTPLFNIRKSICATVGSMFSEFYYVINGSPCLYTLFAIGGKDKHESSEGDRMRLIVLDRRDRVDSEEWTANETVLNSISDVALPVLQRFEGKQANLDVRDVLYVGVVNSTLQLTDAPNVSKKYKPPKNAVVAVIDNRGVYAVQVVEKEITAQWVQRDSNVTYSILPRHFFDKPRSSVVRINTADTTAKLKRTKSREVLI